MRKTSRLSRALALLVSAAMALAVGPENVLRLDPVPDQAFAKRGGGAGGFRGGGGGSRPSGARAHGKVRTPSTRPSRPSGSVQRPSRPPSSSVQRPSRPPSGSVERPSRPPSTSLPSRPPPATSRPARPPEASLPGSGTRPLPERPGNIDRPNTRPPGSRPPPGQRPPGARPPGTRPPAGNRPPGTRPPGTRPPGAGRPPGWNPPNHRPPSWRPPYYPPPYYRPPHYRYGSYYYSPNWGWYFTAGLLGATLVYSTSLPSDKDCQKVQDGGETLYICDGVLYRATYYEGDLVYEIVSDEPGEDPQPVDEGAVEVLGLSLTQPMTRGPAVREVQEVLTESGYDTGGVDGVFGSGTETALLWLQYDYGLEQTGTVDRPTAELLGFLPPSEPPEEAPEDAAGTGESDAGDAAGATEAPASEDEQDAAATEAGEAVPEATETDEAAGDTGSQAAPGETEAEETGSDQ